MVIIFIALLFNVHNAKLLRVAVFVRQPLPIGLAGFLKFLKSGEILY